MISLDMLFFTCILPSIFTSTKGKKNTKHLLILLRGAHRLLGLFLQLLSLTLHLESESPGKRGAERFGKKMAQNYTWLMVDVMDQPRILGISWDILGYLGMMLGLEVSLQCLLVMCSAIMVF